MDKVAVLTGDLVRSRAIEDGDVETVIISLKETFMKLNKEIFSNKASFQIFRGDSFQAITPDIEVQLLRKDLLNGKDTQFEKAIEYLNKLKIK